MSDTLNLLPPRFLLKGRGDNNLTLKIQLDFDATGGTHTVYLAATPTGVALETLTVGDGLTVAQVSGNTHITVELPLALTTEYNGSRLYLSYDLLLNAVLRTQVTAKIVLKAGINAS